MKTCAVVVFAALALIALADHDPVPCKGCQEDMVDIRAEVGNDGKGASDEALLAALKHACERRYPDHLKECYDESVSKAPLVKSLLDAGKSNKDICKAVNLCPSS